VPQAADRQGVPSGHAIGPGSWRWTLPPNFLRMPAKPSDRGSAGIRRIDSDARGVAVFNGDQFTVRQTLAELAECAAFRGWDRLSFCYRSLVRFRSPGCEGLTGNWAAPSKLARASPHVIAKGCRWGQSASMARALLQGVRRVAAARRFWKQPPASSRRRSPGVV